ncbi:hypothetical protein LEMLEM_LOCUS7524 [Lemmus lemmus]
MSPTWDSFENAARQEFTTAFSQPTASCLVGKTDLLEPRSKDGESPLYQAACAHCRIASLGHNLKDTAKGSDSTLSYSSSCCADTPTIKLFLLLLPNCNFATVINRNVNICVF